MSNYSELQCRFCGRIIRNTDKFCIFCGSKVAAEPPKPQITKEEAEEVEKELNTGFLKGVKAKGKESSTAPGEFLIKEGSQDDLDDRILSTTDIVKEKDKKGKEKEEVVAKTFELPEEIKNQFEIKMKLAIVENKKKILKKKLTSLTDELDGNRYEYDIDYAKTMNAKLDAFKTIKSELDQEEEKLRTELSPSGQFRLDELDQEMDLQREQLTELVRQFKNHRIKKDVYEQLKLEYSAAFRSAEDESQELRVNIIRWLSHEKAAKNKLEGRIRLLEGRYKSHEIVQEDFDSQKEKLEKEIETCGQRIKILEVYSRPKKPRIF